MISRALTGRQTDLDEPEAAHEVGEEGQDGAGHHGELEAEGVLRAVVGRLVRLLAPDHVHDGGRGRDVEDLHGRVVQRDEAEEEVQVPAAEDDQEQLLRLERDACSVDASGDGWAEVSAGTIPHEAYMDVI